MRVVTGIVDGTIEFCPYCGGELFMTSYVSETCCEDCGKSFCVIEGESEASEE